MISKNDREAIIRESKLGAPFRDAVSLAGVDWPAFQEAWSTDEDFRLAVREARARCRQQLRQEILNAPDQRGAKELGSMLDRLEKDEEPEILQPRRPDAHLFAKALTTEARSAIAEIIATAPVDSEALQERAGDWTAEGASAAAAVVQRRRVKAVE